MTKGLDSILDHSDVGKVNFATWGATGAGIFIIVRSVILHGAPCPGTRERRLASALVSQECTTKKKLAKHHSDVRGRLRVMCCELICRASTPSPQKIPAVLSPCGGSRRDLLKRINFRVAFTVEVRAFRKTSLSGSQLRHHQGHGVRVNPNAENRSAD